MIDPMRYADRRVGIEVGGVHGGGANVLFCDGHVQWYPKESLMVTNWPHVVSEDPIRRMWNRNDEINNVVGW